MQNNLLRLDEDRILVAQLRLLLRNVSSALIPTFFLCILLIWALTNDSNATSLKVWGVVLMSYKLFATFNARHILASDIAHERTHRMVWTLLVLNGIDGAIWGTLAWITLDTSTVVGSILVISTIAGMIGSSVSRLSPVFPVFITFVSTLVFFLASKLWQLGDPAYEALGFVAIVYLTSVTLMARNSYRETLAAINLRFENVVLLKQLKLKTEIAEASQREAENANTAKSKFLAAASHDLRQPIHAQGLFLEVLARTNLTQHQRELLSSACAASEASAELLNALLDFSRIEAGVIETQLQPIRLQHLLTKIENELAPQADAKDIVYRSRETHITVQSDPLLLELILRNLINNAIRYTTRGGLLVACRKRGNFAVVEVWDTGIGIASAHQKEVFREFHQLGNPERDRHKGLGLGLAIADGLTKTLGHELSLASTLHRGSVFRLTLPITQAPLMPEQAVVIQSDNHLLEISVLVVDDDEAVRKGMQHLLASWGCVCITADSIETALAKARIKAPDLLICDYRLKELRTGGEAIVALRNLLGNSMPAILITGDTAPERLREARASGVLLLHKPVSPSQLYQVILSVMGKTI